MIVSILLYLSAALNAVVAVITELGDPGSSTDQMQLAVLMLIAARLSEPKS